MQHDSPSGRDRNRSPCRISSGSSSRTGRSARTWAWWADCLGEDGGRDPRRAAALLRYTAALLAQVRAHNEGEVDFLWPVAAAAAGQAVDVAPLADDRHAVAAALVQVSQALDAVRAGHGAPADLHALLGRLRGLLDEHITDEEQQTFPAIRRYLRADTYQWCEKQMQRHSPLPARRFAPQWLARHTRPGELRRLRGTCIWPDRILLARSGRRPTRKEEKK